MIINPEQLVFSWASIVSFVPAVASLYSYIGIFFFNFYLLASKEIEFIFHDFFFLYFFFIERWECLSYCSSSQRMGRETRGNSVATEIRRALYSTRSSVPSRDRPTTQQVHATLVFFWTSDPRRSFLLLNSLFSRGDKKKRRYTNKIVLSRVFFLAYHRSVKKQSRLTERSPRGSSSLSFLCTRRGRSSAPVGSPEPSWVLRSSRTGDVTSGREGVSAKQ